MAKGMQRRTVLLGLGLTALATGGHRLALAQSAESQQRPVEGGVGGTGIIGTLQKRDELLINGLRVAATANTFLTDAFGRRAVTDLGTGHSLALVAVQADGGLNAQTVSLFQPLVGPVEAVTQDRQGFSCLGVEVVVEPNAPLLTGNGRPFRLRPGQRVAVSGAWRSPTQISASRIDLIEDSGPMVLAGVVQDDNDGRQSLGSLRLILPSAQPRPPAGSFVTAIGQRSGPLFITERLQPGRFPGATTPLERLSVEGYLEATNTAPGFTIAGLGHSFDEAARVAPLAGELALFVGPYDGDFRVEFGLPLPEDMRARGTLLASLADAFAPEGAISTR